jgi:aminoglycoside phosphotransferase (APT) family kinase protein
MSCSALSLYLNLLGVAVDGASLSELGRMDGLLAEQAALLREEDSWTLLHGDLHLANIALCPDGSVRLLDWGEAAIGPPAWDLALCGAEDAALYLAAWEERAPSAGLSERFYAQLRAAAVCRMHRLLELAIVRLLGEDQSLSAAALPVCLERMVEAAGSPEFRGGRGLRFEEAQKE